MRLQCVGIACSVFCFFFAFLGRERGPGGWGEWCAWRRGCGDLVGIAWRTGSGWDGIRLDWGDVWEMIGWVGEGGGYSRFVSLEWSSMSLM